MAWSLEAFQEHMRKDEAVDVVHLNVPLMEELGVLGVKKNTPAPSKYNNKKTEVDGITFDSGKEADDYRALKLLERIGDIADLELQKVFVLREGFRDGSGKKHRSIKYKCDFFFFDKRSGKWVVKDSKGMKTPTFRMKEKMFIEKYGDQYVFEVG